MNSALRRDPRKLTGEWIDHSTGRLKRGRFKGYILADIPGPYLAWLLFNADNLDWLERDTIEHRLRRAPMHCTTVAEVHDPLMVGWRAGRVLNMGGSSLHRPQRARCFSVFDQAPIRTEVIALRGRLYDHP